MKTTAKNVIKGLNEVLETLRKDNGLFIASWGSFYQKFCWLRDCFYEALAYLDQQPLKYRQTYWTLLDYLKMLEKKYTKFSSIIQSPYPKLRYRYLHARVDAKTYDEVHEEWGNKQNDTVGEILFGIALGIKKGIDIIRDESDIIIINTLIRYAEAIEYWHDQDSGYWEENEEIRSSSIGAVVAGLKAIKALNIPGIIVKDELIQKGLDALDLLLPNETPTRSCDLAQLSLIYPFNIVSEEMGKKILNNIETYLLKENGVIRYVGDWYYNTACYYSAKHNKHLSLYKADIVNDKENLVGHEAPWLFGYDYLGLIYLMLGYKEKALKMAKEVIARSEDGKVGELFYRDTAFLNENNPLGWTVSLTQLLITGLLREKIISKNTLFETNTKIKKNKIKEPEIEEIEKIA